MAIGICLWSLINSTVLPDWESWSFERRSHGLEPNGPSYLANRGQELGQDLKIWLRLAPPRVGPTVIPPAGRPMLATNSVIGRLGIARLGIQTMVREGDKETTLLSSLGHIPGTALPGDRGNVGVAGHRDTFFRKLKDIRKNDVMHFETNNGTFAYEVVSTQIVKPTEVSVLRQGRSAELTLVTCYPFSYIGDAPERFIVKARQLPSTLETNNTARPLGSTASYVTPARSMEPLAKRVEASKRIDERRESTTGGRIVSFSLIKGHTRLLNPGVLMGVTDIDPERERVSAWVLVKANGRTTWLPNQKVGEPIVFRNEVNGDRYQVTLTKALDGIVGATVLLPHEHEHEFSDARRIK